MIGSRFFWTAQLDLGEYEVGEYEGSSASSESNPTLSSLGSLIFRGPLYSGFSVYSGCQPTHRKCLAARARKNSSWFFLSNTLNTLDTIARPMLPNGGFGSSDSATGMEGDGLQSINRPTCAGHNVFPLLLTKSYRPWHPQGTQRFS